MTTEELFRSDNLLVKRCLPDSALSDHETVFVTFSEFTDAFTLDRPGFGEDFLRRHDIPALHVISRDNRWFQYPEMIDALEIVARYVAPYSKVFTYGSSMGAYAALRHARFLNATAIALGPQYSVDPTVMPAEHRWQEPFKQIFMIERQRKLRQPRRAYIFYDPRHRLDSKHVRRISRDILCQPIRLPYAGHVIGNHLAMTDLLSQSVRQIATGTFDPAVCSALAWERRSRSASYLETRSHALERWHPQRALRCARRAHALHPQSGGLTHNLARHLLRAGYPRSALREARNAVTRDPGVLVYRRFLARVLLETGDVVGCQSLLQDLLAKEPDSAPCVHLLATCLSRAGHLTEALYYEKRAIALNPRRRAYRWTHRHLYLRRLISSAMKCND